MHSQISPHAPMAIHSFVLFSYKQYCSFPNVLPKHFSMVRDILHFFTYKSDENINISSIILSPAPLGETRISIHRGQLLGRLAHVFTFAHSKPSHQLFQWSYASKQHIFEILQGQGLKDEFRQIQNIMTSSCGGGGRTDACPHFSCPMHVCKL